MFYIYFEGKCKTWVCDSDSLLRRGTEPIVRFLSIFFLKFVLVILVSIVGIGWVSKFVFQFSITDLDLGEHRYTCYKCGLYVYVSA